MSRYDGPRLALCRQRPTVISRPADRLPEIRCLACEGSGFSRVEKFALLFLKRHPHANAVTAPACGLFLWKRKFSHDWPFNNRPLNKGGFRRVGSFDFFLRFIRISKWPIR
jgi:hypothetical protein